MAAVTPTTANKCKGTFADGLPNLKHYCNKGLDSEGDPIYTCTTWRSFRANCPKSNVQCSSLSEAFVAAVTVCNQRLL
jgi:hypothetical protein